MQTRNRISSLGKAARVGVLLAAALRLSPLAAAPFSLSYGGRLADQNQNPVAGPVDLEIKFYRAATGGTAIGVSPQLFSAVPLTDGVFQTDLQFTPEELHMVFDGISDTFVEVTDHTHNIVYPRQRINASPAALTVPVDNKTISFNSNGQLTVGQGTPAAGQVLSSDSNGNLVWTNPPSAATTTLDGQPIGTTAPSTGQVLTYDGSKWTPSTVAGGAGGTVTSVTGLAPLTVSSGNSTPTISLGTVGVNNGGTGLTSLAINAVLYGSTAATFAQTNVGTQYQVLQAGSTGAPVFAPLNLSATAAISGTLPLLNGGTGATTAAGARSAMGAAAAGVNSDITALSGLTSPLPPNEGGTGVSTSVGPNNVFAGPTSGSGMPAFRVLGPQDLPLMVGSNGTTAGMQGAVPAPAIADNVNFLRGDGHWAAVPGPGGSTNQIQFNNGSSFMGSTNLIWDNTNSLLGIGTSTPSAALDVVANTSSTVINASSNTSMTTMALNVGTPSPSVTYKLTVQGASGSPPNSFQISSSIIPSIPLLLGKPNGGTSYYVGINTASPTFAMDVTGDIRASGCFEYGTTPTLLGGTCASDARLKMNVRSITGALDRLAALRPVTYEYRTEDYPNLHLSKGIQTGFIAQELERVYPDLVVTGVDGFKRVRYGLEMQMQTIAAVKELKASTEAQLAAKDTQIAALKHQLDALKDLVCLDHPDADVCNDADH